MYDKRKEIHFKPKFKSWLKSTRGLNKKMRNYAHRFR